MKKETQMCEGSIVIMIVILMAAVTAIMHVSLRTSSFFLLLAKEREKYENHRLCEKPRKELKIPYSQLLFFALY